MKYTSLFILLLCSIPRIGAQTATNSPALGINNTTTGTNPWTNPGNILVSDNAYASVSTTGSTNYLFAKNFGFSIPGPAVIDGIQLEIEKKEIAPMIVGISDNWSNGLTKTISAGTNRCLVVVAAFENGNSYRELASMTYGGQPMTLALTISSGTTTGFSDRLEVWILLENGISLASGTTITPVYVANTLLENVEFFTSIVFTNVDQLNPVFSSTTTASNSSANPHQLSSPFNTLTDGMSVTGVICGNNTSPASTSGGTNTYLINSSFTEGADIYISNPSFATSGICVETATKACISTASEQPSFTFAGTVNRAAMFGFTLQRARAVDNSVYLLNAGAPVGTNKGTASSWPTTDVYVSYGGPTDVWGMSWSVTDINSTEFGAALSATRSNGNLQVDHFRITVYSTSTLPIELLEFTAEPAGNEVRTKWVTATEQNNDYFVVERTQDGVTFESIGTVDGAGNSAFAHSYELFDPDPLEGVSYYRLKQVDFNGIYTYSPFAAVTFTHHIETSVYPNPSSDGVFTFLQNDHSTTNEVAVFSADLKLVTNVVIAPGEKEIISISGQADGIYFLVYTENGARQVKKVQKISMEK